MRPSITTAEKRALLGPAKRGDAQDAANFITKSALRPNPPQVLGHLSTYPYMFSLSNLLAAVAVDFIGLWGLFTLGTDGWVHRDGSTAIKQPGIVAETSKKLDAPALVTGPYSGRWLSNSDGIERCQAPMATQSGGSIQVEATGLDSGRWLSNNDGIRRRLCESLIS
ncbi:hypothetical protein Daus18300_009389 [Diaporthe australafricana]|uniref:Uncharacterized protein n=1 Tax=Diaporthe australafricana TaxID=127596 RepID=A0ABR3WEA4_9PEZI